MGPKVLCVGTTPAVQRVMVFPRLLPGEVNRARQTLDGVAGKSVNVSKVLRALGGQAVALGFQGGEPGRRLLATLEARGIPCGFVPVNPSTRLCVTLIDETTQTVTELVEESHPVAHDAYERLLHLVEQHLPDSQAIILSGTIATGGPSDLYARCVSRARSLKVLSCVDASGAPLAEAWQARPDVVKPNRKELAVTVGRVLPDETSVWRAMQEVGEQGAGNVVVTAGSERTLAWDGQRGWRVRPPRVQAVNPIGSGDAFTAGLVWRLIQGDDLGEACRWGTAAGAANALNQLAGEVERGEVERLAAEVLVERASLGAG